MDPRVTKFTNILKAMQEASFHGFDVLRKVCFDLKKHFQENELSNGLAGFSNKLDQTSMEIFPEKDIFCKGYEPILVYGDGNCLPRCGSLYAFGHENCHEEIRCRIVFELCTNTDFYLHEGNKVYIQFSNHYTAGSGMKNFEEILKKSIAAFASPGAWGEMWHLLALSSVLKRKIYSIFPDLPGTKRDRPRFHREILPRILENNEPARIFWTNMHGKTQNVNWWTSNHFVACQKTCDTDREIVNLKLPNTSNCQRKPVTLFDFIKASTQKKQRKDKKGTEQSSGLKEINNSYTLNAKKEGSQINSAMTACVQNERKEVPMEQVLNDENANFLSKTSKQDVEIKAYKQENERKEAAMEQVLNEEKTNFDKSKVSNKDVENQAYKQEIEDSNFEDDISLNMKDDNYMNTTFAYCFPDTSLNEEQVTLTEEMYECVSQDFYKTIGLRAAKNSTRDDIRQLTLVHTDTNNEPLSLDRRLNNSKTINVATGTKLLLSKVKLEIRKEKRAHIHSVAMCGEYILKNGPLVRTQTLSQILAEEKLRYLNKPVGSVKRKMSAEVLETLSRHLPVMQIYINRTGFIMEYRSGNIQQFVDSLSDSYNLREAANKNLHTVLENLEDYINLVNTQLDKGIVKAILVELFSVNAVSKLDGAKCKQTLQRARDDIPSKITKLKEIGNNLLTVRNDMTNLQQHQLYKRSLAKAKVKNFTARASGAGREKLVEKCPQLTEVLELAFGEGAKIHPRLTKETRFRSPDLALTMPKAREILLSACSDKLPNIALSTCYTYTENYRANTYQARRHHAKENVNANISLKKLPRIGMVEERINAHYCRSNVNYQLEKGNEKKEDHLVDAKDAKGIVCADIDPVQNIGKSWKKTSRMDHQFDQSRTNACTPMTHLILDTTSESAAIQTDNLIVMNIVRTGQPITLVNLSFYEPETVYRCLNELFLLLTIPALDHLFRNHITGQLKKNWIFVVDNGPSEAPASSLVRMLLVRLVNFLNLDKAIQVSFEKLNSKDNPAERPHASENLALSRHGPFKTKDIFKDLNAKPGTKDHVQNMEEMAKEVINCLRTAKFGGNSFFCFRGVKDNFIFDDEKELRNFLHLSEQGKDECLGEYSATNCKLLEDLVHVWNVEEEYKGAYIDDYNQLSNSLFDDKKTSYLTEYMAAIYSKEPKSQIERFEREPLPDFVRWHSTTELHYMTYEDRKDLDRGEWDDEALFLPSRIIQHVSSITFDPPTDILKLISILICITPEQVKKQLEKIESSMEKQLKLDQNRDVWKDHNLFKKTNSELEAICKEEKIPISDGPTKLEMIELIVQKRNIQIPEQRNVYAGKLTDISTDAGDIMNYTIGHLRSILHFHNLNCTGTKDELVLKVFLLRHQRSYMILHFAIQELKRVVTAANFIIIKQRFVYNERTHIYRKRKFSSMKGRTKNTIAIPDGCTEENLHQIFNPITLWLDDFQKVQQELDSQRNVSFSSKIKSEINCVELCKETGSRVKVFWERHELGTTTGRDGWKIGWYTAHVVSYNEDTDMLNIEYLKESGSIYSLEFTSSMSSGKLKYLHSPYQMKKLVKK